MGSNQGRGSNVKYSSNYRTTKTTDLEATGNNAVRTAQANEFRPVASNALKAAKGTDLGAAISSDFNAPASIGLNAATTMNFGTAIGIDLGTAYSCVAIFQNGKVEIIPNEQGNLTTPSYVAFTDTQRLIGNEAKNQAFMNPYNTIFHSKRLNGHKFHDLSVQYDMEHWPFKVINDGGRPKK
jgi:hypothetical protein